MTLAESIFLFDLISFTYFFSFSRRGETQHFITPLRYELQGLGEGGGGGGGGGRDF